MADGCNMCAKRACKELNTAVLSLTTEPAIEAAKKCNKWCCECSQVAIIWQVHAHLLRLTHMCSCLCTQPVNAHMLFVAVHAHKPSVAVHAHKPSVAVHAHKPSATCSLHMLQMVQGLIKLQLAMQLSQDTCVIYRISQ